MVLSGSFTCRPILAWISLLISRIPWRSSARCVNEYNIWIFNNQISLNFCCLRGYLIIGSGSGFTMNSNTKWIRLTLDTPKVIRFAKWIWTEIHCESWSRSDNWIAPKDILSLCVTHCIVAGCNATRLTWWGLSNKSSWPRTRHNRI